MFLLSFRASDYVIVLESSTESMMLGCLTSSWFFSSWPTSESSILKPQLFYAGSHSICDAVWLLMTEKDMEVLLSSYDQAWVALCTKGHCDP